VLLRLAIACSLAPILAGCGHAAIETPAHTALAARSAATTTVTAATAATAPPSSSTATRPSSTSAPPPPPTGEQTAAPRPAIRQVPIPFPTSRKQEMARYAERHYGIGTYRLVDPRVIVEHYTETPDFRTTYNTFAPDHPDSELHELPNTCAHFVVDRAGTIYQLVPVTIMCRHTVGLNYTAIGIENVGYSDGEILDDPAQMRASLALTRWLRCAHRISVANVIGHNESLSSPYHHEDVPSLRTQTHDDWRRADMDVYRARLRRLPCP